MATIKSFTSLEQSRKLTEILPLESADMYYPCEGVSPKFGVALSISNNVPCWSLAALMKILHRNEEDIVSLSYGGYKDGEYILNWCLDYEFEDGDYKKTFADNPIDSCVAMIEKLHELKML